MLKPAFKSFVWFVPTILLVLTPLAQSQTRNPEQPHSSSAPVLVIFNSYSKASRQVAEHYAAARQIPKTHVCGVQLKDGEREAIAWQEFPAAIRNPVRKCLNRVGRQKVLYLVLTYHTPFRLSGMPSGAGKALDQYLADIWSDAKPTAGPHRNAYFASVERKRGEYAEFQSLADFRQKNPDQVLYSVWRLDGPIPEIARGLVDKALAAERQRPTGQACFDRRFGDIAKVQDSRHGAGEWDLYRAAKLARAAGLKVLEDDSPQEFGTAPAPLRCDDALFYAGWYSYDHYNDAFSWAVGAVGFHLDSASAANPRRGKNWSANALARGITVTSGAVDEPKLEGLPQTDGVLHDLLAGANVGDAFLRNTRWIRWMIINIGDPLYTPFPTAGR